MTTKTNQEIKAITIEEALKYSQEMGEYTDVFPVDLGADFKLQTEPKYYAKINNPRKVRIILTSFRGISPGAVHYYAEIEADGISIFHDEEIFGKVHTISHAGAICEEYKNLPKEKVDIWKVRYNIDVVRPVTQEEIDKDPVRREFYKAGDRTNAFYTKAEAEDLARNVVAARFVGGWEVVVEDNA